MRSFVEIGTRLIRRWDLDGVQLAAILRAQHRPGLDATSFMSAGARSRWLPYLTFAPFVVPGLIAATGILFPSAFLGFAFSYTLIMLIFGLPFLNYCTAVLLDTSENRILLHLPISGRTLLAARLLNMVKYASFLAFAISLPTAVALAVRFGAVALLVFVVSIVLTLIFLVAVNLAFCLLALRHVNPARVTEGILWFQTAFVILTISVAAVALTDPSLLEAVPDVSGKTWWYFYPPAWMAGLLDYTLAEKTRFNGVLAATAILAPLAGFVGCIRLFAGGRFTVLLSRLEAPRSSTVTPERSSSRFVRLSERVSVLINRDKQHRAVFDLTSKLMRSDSALKWQVFPYIGAILINTGVVVAKFGHAPMRDLALFFYCYLPLYLAIIARLMQYRADWRAAWCYQVLPFENPGAIASGAMKAYIYKYVLPVYLLLLSVGAAVWGTAVALNTLFAMSTTILVCLHRFWGAAPVYSKDPVLIKQISGKVDDLLFIPLASVLILTHVVLEAVAGDWGVVAGIVVTSGVIVCAYRRLRFVGFKDSESPSLHVEWQRPRIDGVGP